MVNDAARTAARIDRAYLLNGLVEFDDDACED